MQDNEGKAIGVILGRTFIGIGFSMQECLFGLSWYRDTFLIHFGPFHLVTCNINNG